MGKRKDKITLDIEAEPGVMLAQKGGIKTRYLLDYNPTDLSSYMAKMFMRIPHDTHVAEQHYFLHPSEMHFAEHLDGTVHEIKTIHMGDLMHDVTIHETVPYHGIDFEKIERHMAEFMREIELRTLLGVPPTRDFSVDKNPRGVLMNSTTASRGKDDELPEHPPGQYRNRWLVTDIS